MAESIEHYARTVEQLLAEHRIRTAVAAEMRRPIPGVRKAVRARAVATLPKGGGLNAWVARVRFTSDVRVAGDTVRVKIKAGRNSAGGRSDINAIDRGRVRAPTFGYRGPRGWHQQAVDPGFFREPVAEPDQWTDAADRALDEALEVIR